MVINKNSNKKTIVAISRDNSFARCIDKAKEMDLPTFSFSSIQEFKAWKDGPVGIRKRNGIGLVLLHIDHAIKEKDAELFFYTAFDGQAKEKTPFIMLDPDKYTSDWGKYKPHFKNGLKYVTTDELHTMHEEKIQQFVTN